MSRFANIQMRVCPKSTTTTVIHFFSKSYLSLILIPEYFKIGTTGVMCRIIDQTKKRRKEIQLKINTANKVWKCYTARNLKLKCWSICLKVKCLQAQGLSSATQVEKCFVLFWLLQFSGKIANLVNNGGWWKSFLLEISPSLKETSLAFVVFNQRWDQEDSGATEFEPRICLDWVSRSCCIFYK